MREAPGPFLPPDDATLAAVARHTHHAVVITDAIGRTVWVNDAFTRLSGYGLAHLLGRKPGEVLQGPGTDPQARRELSEAVAAGRPLRGLEIVNYGRDGQPYWLQIDLSPVLGPDGRPSSFIAIQTDISDRISQRQRARSALADAQARAMADLLERERRYVLERLHRELRVPLNSLLGFAQLLHTESRERQDGAAAQRARQIEMAGAHMLDLVDELLAVQDAPTLDGEPTLRPVDLSGALARWVPPEVRRGVRTPDRAVRVWADPSSLRRLLNLACTAALAEGSAAPAAAASVWLDDDHPDFGHIVVCWDLPGTVPPDERSLRADLSERLASMQGGWLDIDTVGGALHWRIALRRAHLDAQDDARPTSPAPWSTAAAPQPMQPRADLGGLVLYVEDDAFNAEIAEQALATRPGVRLLIAPTAEIALLMLAEHRPDLVLLDIVLPGGGEAVLDHLRATPELRDVPCVVLSSVASPARIGRMLERGANGYLTKPVRLDELLACVDRHLEAARRPADGQEE